MVDSLAEKREGFETPNECLKRLLLQRGCEIESEQQPEKQEVKDDKS